MSISERKVSTAAFTSALKQVFYIHKNVVAELCAKLDVLSGECKLFKADSNISKSFATCKSCIHLEKMNRSLQDHFNSLLHEKDMGIKALEAKLQRLLPDSNTGDSQKQRDKILSKEMSVLAKVESLSKKETQFSPENSDMKHHYLIGCKNVDSESLETYSLGETGNLNETELCKSHTRLRLTRPGKRHSRYTEEQKDTKRIKVLQPASDKDTNVSDHYFKSKGLNDTVFVPDTNCATQLRKLIKPALQCVFTEINNDDEADSDINQSQQILVVPETLAIDNSSNSCYDNDVELDRLDDSVYDSQKEPVSNHERKFGHAGLNECFLDDMSDKKGEENVQTLMAESGSKFCDSVLKDNTRVSNRDHEDESETSSKRESESERQCKGELARKQLFQEERILKCAFILSRGEKKDDSREGIQRSRVMQNSVNIIDVEEDSKINRMKLAVTPSPHETGGINASTHDIIGKLRGKEGTQILRKTSNVSIKDKAGQANQENTNSNSKDHSLSQGYSNENSPPVKSLKQTTMSQAFLKGKLMNKSETDKDNRNVNLRNVEEKEKLQMAEAIQRSLKDIQNKCPRKMEDIELTPVKSTLAIINSPQKETAEKVVSNRLTESLVSSLLLPMFSHAPPELGGWDHQKTASGTRPQNCTTKTLNTADFNIKDAQTSSLAPPEPNGSMNPDIHLSEYLNSEIMTERYNHTLGTLDETIAPNLIAQYMLSQQNPNLLISTTSNVLTKVTNQTSRAISSTKSSKTPPKMEISTKTGSWNNHLSSLVTVAGKTVKECDTESKNASTPQVQDDWFVDDDEEDLDGSTLTNMEDDPETIEPSPQQNIQNGSQLRCSIPSISCSFKFNYKRPQLTEKSSVIQEPVKSSQESNNEEIIVDNEESIMDTSSGLLNDNPCLVFDCSTISDRNQYPPAQSLLDSYDKVPKPEEIQFPHVSVVRKKSERNKLEGFSCKQCYEYYKNSGLSEEAMQQKKNDCSRHRERYQAPETPEHFWSLGFPDTAEMIERRQKYNSKESPVAANRAPRRRRRLEKKF